MCLPIVLFFVAHAAIYAGSARIFGSFGGDAMQALGVVAPTIAGSASFGNLSGVYLYATAISAYPLFIAAMRQLADTQPNPLRPLDLAPPKPVDAVCALYRGFRTARFRNLRTGRAVVAPCGTPLKIHAAYFRFLPVGHLALRAVLARHYRHPIIHPIARMQDHDIALLDPRKDLCHPLVAVAVVDNRGLCALIRAADRD